jgi:hypothetical protein
MNARKSVVGAAAVLAAGVVSLGTADTAGAKPAGTERITSVQQLKASIHQAVTVEALSGSALSCCPAGQAESADVGSV